MIVDDVDCFGPFRRPSEHDAPLIVHPDAVLSCQLAPQRLQAVGRWRTQITERVGVMEHIELPPDDGGDLPPSFAPWPPSVEEEVGHGTTAEGPNRHGRVYLS